MDIAKLIRAVGHGALRPMATWPKFSVTSYLVTRHLWDSGVRPATVVDVGANVGQFAVAASMVLHRPHVIAFEPTPDSFQKLQGFTEGLDVECVQAAVGARDGVVALNANVDSRSNSVLDPTDLNLREFPRTVRTSRIEVPVVRLDTFLRGRALARPTLLKIDTQGYEPEVLEGAGDCLKVVDWILVELSFEPMYRGERSAGEILAWLRTQGWALLRPVDFLSTRGGQVLQMDALLAPTSPPSYPAP